MAPPSRSLVVVERPPILSGIFVFAQGFEERLHLLHGVVRGIEADTLPCDRVVKRIDKLQPRLTVDETHRNFIVYPPVISTSQHLEHFAVEQGIVCIVNYTDSVLPDLLGRGIWLARRNAALKVEAVCGTVLDLQLGENEGVAWEKELWVWLGLRRESVPVVNLRLLGIDRERIRIMRLAFRELG